MELPSFHALLSPRTGVYRHESLCTLFVGAADQMWVGLHASVARTLLTESIENTFNTPDQPNHRRVAQPAFPVLRTFIVACSQAEGFLTVLALT